MNKITEALSDIELTDKINDVIDGLDGAWTPSHLEICENRAAQTTDKAWPLSSYLPNDGFNYEVLFTVAVTTGTTSGDCSSVYFETPLIYGSITALSINTRTNSSMKNYAAAIIPIGTNRKITVRGVEGNTGTYSLHARGYRRLGKNS